ncbi:OmpA family protein [Pantoea endophytica]|uniref:OmpA family protein n=1 Tax=Pantoea endophytica TaxID=92488 RepID=UPI001AE72F85|nr:OmpA family protein [Pantoea endophytica]
MRRSFTLSVLAPTALCVIALLWLLWCFIALTLPVKWLISLVMVLATAAVLWPLHKRYASASASSSTLLAASAEGPIVLVYGNGRDDFFADEKVKVTAQGSLHRAEKIEDLRSTVEQIWDHSPSQAGRMSVTFSCIADEELDEGELRAQLKALRQQLRAVTELTGLVLPVTLQCQFSGPATPWILVRDDEATLTDADGNQLALDDWQRQGNNILCIPIIRHAWRFLGETLLDELQKTDRLSPAVSPVAVSLRCGSAVGAGSSLWQEYLQRHAVMMFTPETPASQPATTFADPLFAVLTPLIVQVQGGRTARRVMLVLLFCALVALACSTNNNRKLIEQTGYALQRWHAIPMDSYAAKASSLASLQQQALLLERWHRQGEPLRYGLGLYPGARLWLALQQAIDSYVPQPAPKPKPVPKIIRLDSMSLFDSGKFALKEGSTRFLVNSLVGIKARPGWLIVVSGHTDNTGNPPLNQTLSLKRAEAVRDWMRDTGDVPESCFAVQGYGESRPIESNDTAEGRALNRRVEISLVPQADACNVPDTTLPSSQDDDGSEN